ncbi:MAG: tetratricopeptide repeat protein [Oscillatoriales cyanobacterium SM2_2_1]|nr:tetratricopeptide repeat protein [Oscillatoriales cyanobacterium SM2_2_1]
MVGQAFCRGIVLGICWGIGAAGYAQTPSAATHRADGLSYRQQEQWPAAIAQFRQAVALEPDNPQNYVLLGWTQHLAGQSQDAAGTLWEGVFRQPMAVAAFNALGIVYLVRGERIRQFCCTPGQRC